MVELSRTGDVKPQLSCTGPVKVLGTSGTALQEELSISKNPKTLSTAAKVTIHFFRVLVLGCSFCNAGALCTFTMPWYGMAWSMPCHAMIDWVRS